jgi:hypothetical protein
METPSGKRPVSGADAKNAAAALGGPASGRMAVGISAATEAMAAVMPSALRTRVSLVITIHPDNGQ